MGTEFRRWIMHDGELCNPSISYLSHPFSILPSANYFTSSVDQKHHNCGICNLAPIEKEPELGMFKMDEKAFSRIEGKGNVTCSLSTAGSEGQGRPKGPHTSPQKGLWRYQKNMKTIIKRQELKNLC